MSTNSLAKLSTPVDVYERTPPHSVEAELSTLGSMAMAGNDAELFDSTAANLTAASFFYPEHGVVFDALVAVRETRGVVDFVLLRDELRRRGQWDEVGGKKIIEAMASAVPAAAHGPSYAATVAAMHGQRELISIANELLKAGYAAGVDSANVANNALNRLLTASAGRVADRVVSMADAADAVRANLTNEAVRRVPTGIDALDEEIGGLPIGKMTIIGGRPGMGKSLVSKAIVHNVAERDEMVGIVSIEEDRVKIAENAAAMLSGIDNRKINANRLTVIERDSVLEALDRVSKRPVKIIDDVYLLRDVEAAITTLAVRFKAKLVIVDHIHLIDLDEGPREENETRKVTKISRRLKALGKRLGIALVCCAQLNRGNEARAERPQTRDLRESGSLEQDGDLIILLHREDYYHKDEKGYPFDDVLELLIRKNKDGRCGTIPVTVNLKTQSIVESTSGKQGTLIQPDDADDAARVAERVREIF